MNQIAKNGFMIKNYIYTRLLKAFVFFFVLGGAPDALAYIYKGSVWRSCDSRQDYSYIIVCHDLHNYSQPLNNAQIDVFKQAIPQCKDMSLILEDQPASAQEYKNLNLYNCGAELKELCEKAQCNVRGVDFRFKKRRAYYKCLRSLDFKEQSQFDELNKQLTELDCTTQSLAKEFYDEYLNAQNTILLLKNQKNLSLATADMLQKNCLLIKQQWEQELTAWENFNGTFLEYCQKNNCLNAEYLTKSLTFDASMLDIRLFLTALVSANKVTVVYAGGMHCNNLESYLYHHSPFSLVESQGINFSFPQDTLKIPDTISPAQTAKYMMTAEKLYKADGVEVKPIEPEFFTSFVDPELYIQKLSWWKKVKNFARNCRFLDLNGN